MNKTLSGRRVVAYESLLKNKGKVQLGNPESGRKISRAGPARKSFLKWSRWLTLFITKFKSQFKRGFTKVVAT